MLVHFAAESHVDRSIHGTDVFIDTNLVGTYSLLKATTGVTPSMRPRFAVNSDTRPDTTLPSHFVTSMTAPIASGGSDFAGWAFTRWKAPPCHGARQGRSRRRFQASQQRAMIWS